MSTRTTRLEPEALDAIALRLAAERGTVLPERVHEAAKLTARAEGKTVTLMACAQAVYRAEVTLDPELRIEPTPEAVRDARNRHELRRDRIAVRAGISVGKAKALYEQSGGDLADSYTGRGTRKGQRWTTGPVRVRASTLYECRREVNWKGDVDLRRDRHSSPLLPDQERSLAKRGRRDAKRIAKHLARIGIEPDGASVTVLALLTAIPANPLAATALAEFLSRRRSCERIAEALVRWSHT
jgi:hypothetical protein